MIRPATYSDTRICVELLQDFLKETAYAHSLEALRDREHLSKIVWLALQRGRIWLGQLNDQPVGLLICIREANMWYPRAQQLRELVFYVRQEHRNGSIGGRLFKTYCDYAEDLLREGSIEGYFTTRMSTTVDYDLERRGFQLREKTYLKD